LLGGAGSTAAIMVARAGTVKRGLWPPPRHAARHARASNSAFGQRVRFH
jgi:hypothetical protein